MADPRFFSRQGPFALEELARRCGATLDAGGDKMVADVAPLSTAGPDEVSFLDNKIYLDQLAETRAGAVILRPRDAERAPKSATVLLSDHPYRAYALTARSFYSQRHVESAGTSPAAHVDPGAQLGAGCQIDPGAVVEAGAEIGPDCRISANAVIGRGVVLGENCYVGPGATLTFCKVGARVVIHAGARIGQDGFGFAQDPSGHVKVPQLGRVLIGDDVEIGANTTIDRGAGPDTVIGPGCIIDNLVQIGHNVELGRGCTIVSQTGISGSTRLEDFVVLAGQVGVGGHLTIGKGAIVAATSAVAKSLPGGQAYGGMPAIPAREWRRQLGAIALLGKGKLKVR